MAVLIDTNFLLAATYAKDENHAKAQMARQSLKGLERVVPAPVVQEMFYMTTSRFDYIRAIVEFERLQSPAFKIEPVISEDMHRMVEIMRKYTTANFDYTDVAIMTMSERLNIRQVYTFDHRDFRIFRPKHCEYLELLP